MVKLLRQLELHGLKSFADKTALDLSHNITAIVGPNGSGKSNITDAIRWLLGERDARNLRGAKGEDLIFAGTETRPRMGLAQATLVFDNSSGFFPIDVSEVSISRRVSRDGVSQFFINKSEVRLKDLVDFLAHAKLGARGLTIINQGESDVFIKARPEERREMIEEMLGLKEYQLKKADAVRKLEATSVNLDKVRAMLDELRPHVRFLRRQSARYENRERIASELAELEIRFYGSRLRRFQRELSDVQQREREVERLIRNEQPAYQKLEADIASISEQQPEAAQRLKEIQEKRKVVAAKRAELDRELGRIEAQLEFQSRLHAREDADLAAALREVHQIASRIVHGDAQTLRDGVKSILAIIEKIFTADSKQKESGVEEKYRTLASAAKKLDGELSELNRDEMRYQGELRDFNQSFRDAYEKLERERKKLHDLVARKNNILIEKERVEVRLAGLAEELSQAGRDIASLEAALKGGAKYDVDSVDEDGAMHKIHKLRQELLKIGEIDEAILAEAKETEERYAFLEGQVADLEKATRDLAALVRELDEKIYTEFNKALRAISDEFHALIREMFGGGKGKLTVRQAAGSDATSEGGEIKTKTDNVGVDIELALPGKRLRGLEVLSGGERSLVSIAALFALISVSPPPFLVLDEVDAALDEKNARRFGKILKDFARKTQFVIVTHNRATMEAADVLYGVTMSPDGTSKLVSLKLS